jgi:hypothetical protein
MIRYVSLFVFVLSSNFINAQFEAKYSSESRANPIEWINLLYSDNADAGKVIDAYNLYYSKNEFVKNEHTQYFKRWLKSITRGVDQIPGEIRDQKSNANRVPDWSCIGPYDWDHSAAGRSYAPGSAHIYTIEQSISNPDILYAGSAEAGVWKSINRGNNWTALTNTLNVTSAYAIEIAYNDPNVVYVSILNSIYKTTNGGSTWAPTGNAAFQALNLATRDIKMDPTNSNIVLAATNNGLYRSVDAGGLWTQIVTGDFQEIEFHPSNVNTIYASRVNGDVTNFYRSLNNGVSFTQIGAGWPSPNVGAGEHQRRVELAVSPASPNSIYAHATGNANGGSGLYGIYVSNDQGSNWTFTCCGTGPGGPPNAATNKNIMAWSDDGSDDGGQFYYDVAFAVSPTNSSKMFASGVNLWVSDDAGVNWTCPAKWSHSHKPNYVHADIHDINYYAHTNEIWVATDGGIFVSTDNGNTFTRKVTGIFGTDFWGYGQGWWEGDIMLGGAYHNGTLLKENNVYINDWICTDGGDGTFGFVNPGRSKNVHSWFDIKDLKSNRTISPVTRGNPREPNGSYTVGNKSDILFHPNYYDTWWVGSGNIMYKTIDNGFTFTTLHDFGTKIGSMDHCFSNPEVIYTCTFPGWWSDKKVYRSDNGGSSFVEITPPTSLLVNDFYIPFDVAVDPIDPMKVYLVRTPLYGNTNLNGRVVFYSNNGGATWTNITASFPSNIDPTNIALQYGSNGGIFIGTRKNVWYKNNASSWTNIASDQPVSTYSEKIVPLYRNGKIRNASNRSVWERNMPDVSQPLAMPSVQATTLSCTQDTAYFVDRSVVSENGVVWAWSFPGGTPSSSNERTPKVVYENPGNYDVTLTVTDINGTSSKTISKLIAVLTDCKGLKDPGKALIVNATNQYVNVQNVNWNTNNFTFTAWIKPDGIQPEYSGLFMADGSAAGLNFKTNNTLGYHWPNGSWSWNSNLTAPAGVWSHVALVITPTSAKIYLNGVVASHTATLSPANIQSFKLASYQGWSDRNFKGQMEEACIWDRALSQNEIREKRHLTKDVATESGLVAYYKFNENGSIVYDYKNSKNGNLNAAATTVISTAPVGKGFSDRLTINANGTFPMPNAGAVAVFNGGTNPNGEVVMSHLLNDPNYTEPNSAALSRGYYILNNYGSNQTFTGLSSIAFNNLGTISQFMANTMQPNLRKRSDNADVSSWNLLTNNPVTVTTGNAGIVNFTGTANVLNASGQLIIDRANFGLTEPQVSIAASTSTDSKITGGASAELSIKANAQTFVLPHVSDSELSTANNPIEGLMGFDLNDNTIVFRSQNGWELVKTVQIYLPSQNVSPSSSGVQLSSSKDTSAIFNLAEAPGMVLLPSYNNNNLTQIEQPNISMMIYNTDLHKIQVFDGVQWITLLSIPKTLKGEMPIAQIVPGIAVGKSIKDPNANLEISNQNYRTLSLPQAPISSVYKVSKGSITFDPQLKEYMLYDGLNWKKLIGM